MKSEDLNKVLDNLKLRINNFYSSSIDFFIYDEKKNIII